MISLSSNEKCLCYWSGLAIAVPIFRSTQIELEAMSINPLSSWYLVHKNLPKGFYSLQTPAVRGSGGEEADEDGSVISANFPKREK